MPEFIQGIGDCIDRELEQHRRVPIEIIDGPRWHAGCFSTSTSQHFRWLSDSLGHWIAAGIAIASSAPFTDTAQIVVNDKHFK